MKASALLLPKLSGNSHRHVSFPAAIRALRMQTISDSVSVNDVEERESEKMMSEGGSSCGSFHEVREELVSKKGGKSVDDYAGERQTYSTESAKEYDRNESSTGVVEGVREHMRKERDTARDMVKDIPKKISETTQELKEVGVEAAKALKRDMEKAAEKVGIKDPKPGDLDKGGI